MLSEPQLDAIAELIADRVADKLRAKLSAKWVTRKQYAEITSLSLRTVDQRLKDGLLKFRKDGKRVLIEAP